MSGPKKILRALTVAALLQVTLIFLVKGVLTTRLSAIANNLGDYSVYRSDVAVEQMDKVNQAFSSVSNELVWIFLAGMVLTSVGYGLLRSIIMKAWPAPNRPDIESS